MEDYAASNKLKIRKSATVGYVLDIGIDINKIKTNPKKHRRIM